MKDLIGQRCACDFNLPSHEWPIPGYPAWVEIVDVDMPMICMRSSHGGRPMWVNASVIKTINATNFGYSADFDDWWKGNAPEFGGGLRYKYAAYRAWEAGRALASTQAEGRAE